VHLEELRRRGMAFPGSYMSLAETYLATGQPDKARDALTAYVAAHPDSSAGLENLGFFELSEGQTDAALAAFDKAAGLAPYRDAEDREGPRRRPCDARRVVRGRGLRQAPDDIATTGASAGRAARRSRWPASIAATSARPAASRPRGSARPAEPTSGSARGLFRARLESDLGRHRAALADAEQAIAEKGPSPSCSPRDTACARCRSRISGRAEEAKRSEAMVDAFIATIPR
jgi:tetratricopeptide (TPR) repeat protein